MRTGNKRALTVLGIGLSAVVLMAGTATAASKITAHQLATGAVNGRVINNGAVHQRDLSNGLSAAVSAKDLHGAVYRVANYLHGGNGWATVACADKQSTSQRYTAISGGVQGYSDPFDPSAAVSVTNSFPGRMDWTTDTPKPQRLDGWVIGLTSGDDATLKVWALCVRNSTIPTETTDY